eukprot:TRINITY_DN12987_c0_g1_i1.p1 TRINITY_DN12987_c0_g1~~TRINITY_DN12987_c0_g1_i1.p1  ORF type:complete len:140 (-),score=30.12 TRINITY_DN12987_c0_g1_i1:145-519(-)
MKFSKKQLILIIISTVLLTLAVLRFVFGSYSNYWTWGVAVPMIILAVIGLYGAYKLNNTALLVFFIGLVVVLIIDLVNLFVFLGGNRWRFANFNLLMIIEITLLIVGAVVSHLLRTNKDCYVRL